jgi:methylated-DNA-[protein]-cysteine S-methyltransferase
MTSAAACVQTTIASPLGPMLLAASPHGLIGAWFTNQRHLPPAERIQVWPQAPTHAVLVEASRQLSAYFQGARKSFELPLDFASGTAFQQAVWQALLQIPAGATLSYGALARQLGKPAAVRAVGAAVGRNPLSIVVPCHRVLGANGTLTGYAGGLERKTALLELEGALVPALHQSAPPLASTQQAESGRLAAH